MEQNIYDDFQYNGLTPFDLHIKYNIPIERVYIILKTKSTTTTTTTKETYTKVKT